MANSSLDIAPGSVVTVRDEDWLVTQVENTQDGLQIGVRGITPLVRDTSATFLESLDRITVRDPRKARVVADGTPGYRRARLYLETVLRKTPVPRTSGELTVATKMLSRLFTNEGVVG